MFIQQREGSFEDGKNPHHGDFGDGPEPGLDQNLGWTRTWRRPGRIEVSHNCCFERPGSRACAPSSLLPLITLIFRLNSGVSYAQRDLRGQGSNHPPPLASNYRLLIKPQPSPHFFQLVFLLSLPSLSVNTLPASLPLPPLLMDWILLAPPQHCAPDSVNRALQ